MAANNDQAHYGQHPTSNQQRRNFLRNAFYAGSAVATSAALNACSGGGGSPNIMVQPDTGSGNSGTPVARSSELQIPTGRLAKALEGTSLLPADANGIQVPEGFTAKVVATSGSLVTGTNPTAYSWHSFPDGGACYETDDGGWVYTSNSEVVGSALGQNLGGAGAIRFNANGSTHSAYRILSNTQQNCAGGKTPWGTWMSGEENSSGQLWDCDPLGVNDAIAVPALGLFGHEGMAVDPKNRVCYMTEDAGSGSRFYRWVPDEGDWPTAEVRPKFENGTLQVCEIVGLENGGYVENEDLDRLRDVNPITWSDCIDPHRPQGDVRGENSDAPGTRFPGNEGIWYYELPEDQRQVPQSGQTQTAGLIFFTSKGDNRVYAIDVENQLIEVILDNDNGQISPGMSDVDNLTVSPWGDILVAEDLVGARTDIRIIIAVPNQPAIPLVIANHSGSEICGPAFSPDGSRLYFSSQRGGNGTGQTIEITLPESIYNPTVEEMVAMGEM